MEAAKEVEDVGETSMQTERIPDVRRNASWTYMEFRLSGDSETNGIRGTVENGNVECYMHINGNTLSVESRKDIAGITIYSADGRVILESSRQGRNVRMNLPHKGFAVISIKFADGNVLNRKITL